MADIDIDKPLWDLRTFTGRFMHFLWVTDPRTCFTTEEELNKAKDLVLALRRRERQPHLSLEEIHRAKKLYESAFHPDSGELQNIFGRMSFQMPGGMAITGAMLQWYRTNTAVIFWQWVNQSFNALVNYTNRNANSSLTTTQLVVSYVSATSSALVAAVGYKKYLTMRASPFFQRYVPFVAVAVANCINIPLMRQNELMYGIDIEDENGKVVGKSRAAAAKGITQVVFSRIAMCAPGMLILPVIMESLEKYKTFRRMSLLHAPFQVAVVGCFLTIMVPVACALFPQTATLNTNVMKIMEPQYYKAMAESGYIPATVYFNKGL
ncbi:sideroflexin-2 [Toxorhynchites rutilus septentrionalis]|uniref:sideroflexin-2 n=1 Tax=Toxorhynchites rutilus septentrionalis TaxID=329112 RepID=UPI0024784CC3|nr:sideroflexin-2 [Toxorhynchites rutilus septentrionalis]XP_055628249.1 sideroflexin-2 [Toxorhynchites rutilus septentrionalis]XP_055628250.1 sideroflexin-2 [Toxorhynchites rutilus septentrionalis]XP_055628251.1 sideroflexin-2 [Toxorhynchites rutilus septentrionalis]